ncbi:MAG TPA: ABC transporter permease [Vicinamibacterales bacterium]|nr:ABC transporter permease [Vicinamibacterales bacterium]
MLGLWSDLVFAARVLRGSRGFTIMATASLALAIGANTTIFSVGKQLLFDRLDVPHASSLRLLATTGISYPVYEQLRAQNTALGDLLAFHATAANATVGDNAERVLLHEVSGNYYEVLGVTPQIGRGIRPSDDTPASPAVATISDAFWEREFARSPAAIGQAIRINDVPVTIVGVNPNGFTGAGSTLPSEAPAVIVTLAKAALDTPASNGRNWVADPAAGGLIVIGRAKPGGSDRTAQAMLNAQFAATFRAMVPMREGDTVPTLVLRDGSRGLFTQQQAFATPIAVLMLFLALVLLLACANIATLMLARGVRRQREMSVRLALGAGRRRIFRQMLVESLLLATIGGLSGLALAYAGRSAVAQYTPQVNWQVFGFTAAITIVTGLLFGCAPAFAAVRTEIADRVKRSHTVGRSVVGFQIALATLLVISAGLFIRSLAGLTAVNPGFRTDHLLLAQVVLPQNRYPAGANVAFHQRMEQAIAAIPGVASVAGAEAPYLSGEQLETTLLPQGEALDASTDQTTPYNAVGVDFFNTLGIPILAGRAFNEHDTGASPKVAVINRRLAAMRFPHENPIGKLVSVGVYSGYGDILSTEPLEIVGVSGDTLYDNLHETASPQLFIPYAQQTQVRRLTYMIRTQVAPEAIVPALRRVLRAADPALPLVAVRTQQAQIDEDLADERLLVSLSSIFGVLALVLASIGIYGVMALSVAQRTRDIGIRMAVGAIPRQILAMVLREASSLSVIAIAAGVGASMLAARFMRSVLFGIESSDPITLGSAAGLLLVVVLAASWIPARRAAHVHPMDALRRE